MSPLSSGTARRNLAFEIEMLLPADQETFPTALGRSLQRRRHVGALELIGWQNVFDAHGHGVVDAHRWDFGGDLDVGQPCGTPRRIAGFGNHGKYHLAVKLDLALGEDRIVVGAARRAAIIDPGNIRRRQHRENTGSGADGSEVKQRDLPARPFPGIARRHMHRAFRFAHVVDVGGVALHMQRCTVMRQGLAHGLGCKRRPCIGHLRPPSRAGP